MLFRYFSEARDKQLLQSVNKTVNARKQIDLKGTTSLSPSDLHCLTFFLSNSFSTTWLKLDLCNCQIFTDC